MANDLEQGGVRQVAPELAKAVKLSVAFQALGILFSALRWAILPSGHFFVNVTLVATLVFWLWFGFVVFLRGNSPTRLDLLAAQWSFPFLWVFTLIAFLTVAGFGAA